MHGYELMSEITDRTGGVWQPSPGSVYPTLALLEDEGLVAAQTDGGSRRTFSLTEAGREAAPAPTGPAPWAGVVDASDPALEELRRTLRSVRVAVEQVVEAGSPDDRAKAQALLVELRKALYLLLAGDG
jgi:DNA-binding PadR family transcriptional regulator